MHKALVTFSEEATIPFEGDFWSLKAVSAFSKRNL